MSDSVECDECGGIGIVDIYPVEECSKCEGSGFVTSHLYTSDEIFDARSDYEYDKYKDDKLTGDL